VLLGLGTMLGTLLFGLGTVLLGLGKAILGLGKALLELGPVLGISLLGLREQATRIRESFATFRVNIVFYICNFKYCKTSGIGSDSWWLNGRYDDS